MLFLLIDFKPILLRYDFSLNKIAIPNVQLDEF